MGHNGLSPPLPTTSTGVVQPGGTFTRHVWLHGKEEGEGSRRSPAEFSSQATQGRALTRRRRTITRRVCDEPEIEKKNPLFWTHAYLLAGFQFATDKRGPRRGYIDLPVKSQLGEEE